MFKKKPTASEIDGVQYRRAKTWQIILCACNALLGLTVYSLIGMASYSASIGYGIATASVGIILTCTRIFDAITDPLVAFLYDRVNTKFGKVRILLIGGHLIEALALWLMFDGLSSKGFGFAVYQRQRSRRIGRFPDAARRRCSHLWRNWRRCAVCTGTGGNKTLRRCQRRC